MVTTRSGARTNDKDAQAAGPLEGTSIFVLVKGRAGGVAKSAVQRLGGTVVTKLTCASHCVVQEKFSAEDLAKLEGQLFLCQEYGVAVVGASWLDDVGALARGADWSDVPVDPHVPAAIRDFCCCPPPKRRREADRVAAGEPGEQPRPPPTQQCATGPSPLAASLDETWGFLRREYPEQAEAGELRHAIEQSLLDHAITLRQIGRGEGAVEAPEHVLGVSEGASAAEIRSAFRKKALSAHPDKGGSPGSFLRLQRALQQLAGDSTNGEVEPPTLAAPQNDKDLHDHRALVQAWFAKSGVDLEQTIARQQRALAALKLKASEAGSTNKNERGRAMYNQCFYLSLARAYLRNDTGKSILEETALHLKRVIEAAVLQAHPEWSSRIGEDVQAFSDFLFFVMGSNALLSELAVAVFDSSSGGVEVWKGKHYPADPCEAEQRSNLVPIYFLPGHYQALVSESGGHTLGEVLACLDTHEVQYVVTDC